MGVNIFSEATVSTSLTLGDVPMAKIGPSLTSVGEKVYMFGGRCIDSMSTTNDLYIFSLETLVWEKVVPKSNVVPAPRFMHSACMFNDSHLIISGGGYFSQGTLDIQPINDICIFNLETMNWEIIESPPPEFPPRYAHLSSVVGKKLHIVGGQGFEKKYHLDLLVFDIVARQWQPSTPICISLGTHFSAYCGQSASVEEGSMKIFYNSKGKTCTRELVTLKQGESIQTLGFSSGSLLPPGLRFPDAHFIGNKLVVSGSFTSNNLQAYTLWFLDMDTMEWSAIDTGSCLARGSWNRGILHSESGRYVVFGHRDRNPKDDYMYRRINFNHISTVNLEAFSIYHNPIGCEDPEAVELGLMMMYEPRYSNFALITNDGFRIHANSGFLKLRWSHFDNFVTKGQEQTQDALFMPTCQLRLQESYYVVQVFVRFLYTNCLDFEEANDLDVLGKLLIFSRNYTIKSLSDLAAFHLHRMLTVEVAPAIFRYASLAQRDGLRLRSLSMMIRERAQLALDRSFWTTFPDYLRDEILSYMPPNFTSPFAPEEPPTPKRISLTVDYSLHFLPTHEKYIPTSKGSIPSCTSHSDTVLSQPTDEEEDLALSYNGDDSPSLAPICEVTEPIDLLGSVKSRKSKGTSSFLKFGSRRPSLASFFSFSSSSSNAPPPSSTTTVDGNELDPKLTRALSSYGIGTR